MKYKYVADSCCEFPDFFTETHDCANVALTIEVGDRTFVDDETFHQADFLSAVKAYPKAPKSSCPSPEAYMNAFDGDADVVFVTGLSSELSGSYNSAILAKNLYEEEHPEKKIFVFNSESASCGEFQIMLKAAELVDEGKDLDEIVKEVENFAHNQQLTYFVLESMEALRKAGRLSAMKAMAATALNIKPVCIGLHGTIEQESVARGMNKALAKMTELSLGKLKKTGIPDTKDRTLCITHVNCPERAAKVLAMYVAEAEFKRTVIIEAKGVTTLYAADGGIIVTM
ncbi:MAG: DegV family protein [Lachnospiraceae bacterium]|nr:DegV family protein [Lachnospiraceae bacterium]